nr:hypothetical protein B0A51_03853 [Rachicladosporium sp. CCFEE 5018]
MFRASIGSFLRAENIEGLRTDANASRHLLAFEMVGMQQGILYGLYNKTGRPFSQIAVASPADLLGITAKECGLWTCLQARQVNVRNGIAFDTTHNKTDVFHNIPQVYNVKPDISFDFSHAKVILRDIMVSLIAGKVCIDGMDRISYSLTAECGDALPLDHPVGVDTLHAAWRFLNDVENW